ncbi:MAG: gamma carbonic anhydrase family protein [Deltaproteobacteria bacterium]|jgi:carbonic anhydrase/acetyltransferase-like protein (isoleucine patch superfamily)|nr:gamma carbonic anhydrase family protein [Deltaproteobacteria bacterium]MDP6216398.1 gamma carbonic anhydrase family protein [SAR324 cluster bacterium]RZO46755.1 MAG: gamma carbonic anhydrase family protein [Pseudomonadota bacterium]MEC9069863.1 gamma carbonic anhydrase family protein [SAR324 cluster bacterium]HAF89254.1 gamma carbonic anhydrase family protein [Deltaproteobacteria bacterium]|tara:strand:- start:112 stop:639 length:528 start_codon:yes stop_codon:yes gene_type:complete
MTLYTLDNSTPEFPESAFIAPDASLIGRVRIGEYSSVWFNAVLRGDMEHISIGDETSFQDLSMGHADPRFPLIIGNRVTVGHHCVMHGCKVEDDCLIGMGAVLMNGVKIGRGSIVGAGAVLLEGMEVPPFSMVAGSPAKIRKTYEESILANIRTMSQIYVKRAIRYREQNIGVII